MNFSSMFLNTNKCLMMIFVFKLIQFGKRLLITFVFTLFPAV
jgi:hypothetical protein